MLSIIEIGEKIAVARKMRNLSQAKLAEVLAVSAQAVGKWERGESMPDIVMFGRLAETLGVDLNYFGSEKNTLIVLTDAVQSPDAFQSIKAENESIQKPGWNMSGSNWVDIDFSGLHGLAEKFSGSNIEKCQFVGSEMSGLILKGNNIKRSDFTRSNLSKCKFSGTNFENDIFIECDFRKSEFSRDSVYNCDFSGANMTDVVLKWYDFRKVKLSGATLFGTIFQMGQLTETIFDGEITNCSFENCDFSRVEFHGATICNTFFKNSKLKRVKFIDCKVDRLSYAFMKSCKADLTDVKIIEL